MKDYTSKAARPYPFRLDGVQWQTEGSPSLLDLSEMATLADVELRTPAGMAAISGMFKAAMGSNYAAFLAHCRVHSTDPDVLFEILRDMVEHVTGNPTSPSQPSSLGPPATTVTYGDAPLSTSDTGRVGTELTDEQIHSYYQAVDEVERKFKEETGREAPPKISATWLGKRPADTVFTTP